jgi:hypothetical protein
MQAAMAMLWANHDNGIAPATNTHDNAPVARKVAWACTHKIVLAMPISSLFLGIS